MKIAIPVNDNSQTPEVSASFGRAPYFLIYDDGVDKKEIIENPAAQSMGGAGVLAAQIVADSGAKVLLTPRCGQNAADVLKVAGVQMFKSIANISALQNIEAYVTGKLIPLNDIHPGFHGH